MPRSTPNRRGKSTSDYGSRGGWGAQLTPKEWDDPTLDAVAAVLEPTEEPATTPVPWTSGRVYFAHFPALRRIKIGYSNNVPKRHGALRSTLPQQLRETRLLGTMIGDTHVERLMHERFAQHRITGEWFSDKILPEVERLIAEDEEWFAS